MKYLFTLLIILILSSCGLKNTQNSLSISPIETKAYQADPNDDMSSKTSGTQFTLVKVDDKLQGIQFSDKIYRNKDEISYDQALKQGIRRVTGAPVLFVGNGGRYLQTINLGKDEYDSSNIQNNIQLHINQTIESTNCIILPKKSKRFTETKYRVFSYDLGKFASLEGLSGVCPYLDRDLYFPLFIYDQKSQTVLVANIPEGIGGWRDESWINTLTWK